MSAAEPILELDDVEVRYGSVPAVRGLTLSVGRGEVVAIVGPNGAGKSSTLLAIMGVVPVSRGDIRFAGRSLVGKPPDAIARSGIALVPEGRHVFGDFTVEENLRLGLTARSSRDGVEDDIAWVSSLFPVVGDARHRQAGLLSGGQQQQLAIARALVARPALLLLDEPSLGLAPSVVDAVFDTLSDIRDAGVTIVLVEQRGQLAVGFADRSYVLSNGELKLELHPSDADDTEKLTEAYFGS